MRQCKSHNGPAFVIGGAGAIGAAISARLVDSGRSVVKFDQCAPEGPASDYQYVDVTDQASVATAVDQAVAKYGRPDTLIYTAGYLEGAPILDLESAELQTHLDVNLFGALFVAQKVAELMKHGGGRILFISSIHGQIGVPNRGAYAMSKAALGALSRALAVELSPYGIRVNVLAPGPVDAGMQPNPEVRGRWEEETPAGRVARLEEVAHFAELLTSEHASFLSGQTIALDGGVSTLRAMAGPDSKKS